MFISLKSRTVIMTLLLLCVLFAGGNSVMAAPSFPGGLIIDHTAVADFDQIPSVWINAAKEVTLHYAHTSHGSQIVSGINWLETSNSGYGIAVRESDSEGLPPVETPAKLRIYDGNPPETYITPEDYWDSDSGMNRTRTVADTGHYHFSMWSWCGQQSSNSVSTVNHYLNNFNTLESEYPNMRFILMTGHTDGSDTPTTPNTLKYNNELVRQYARDNNKIVFDFADIESWDPSGQNYPTNGNPDGACNWCSEWCTNHPADCQNLPSCAHTHGFNCILKGKAFWYMMARLAGWDGTSTCETLPARNSSIPHDYTTLEKAYTASSSAQTILLQARNFYEDFNITNTGTITIKGGYDCDYLPTSGLTSLTGKLTISTGAAVVENLVIK